MEWGSRRGKLLIARSACKPAALVLAKEYRIPQALFDAGGGLNVIEGRQNPLLLE
jgi:hypothetical protein